MKSYFWTIYYLFLVLTAAKVKVMLGISLAKYHWNCSHYSLVELSSAVLTDKYLWFERQPLVKLRVHMGSHLGYLRTSIFGLNGSHWLSSEYIWALIWGTYGQVSLV